MKVNRLSWHYKTYKFLREDRALETPSVCAYWGMVFGVPLLALMLLPVLAVAIPLGWLGAKLEARLKGRTLCPFGRVELED